MSDDGILDENSAEAAFEENSMDLQIKAELDASLELKEFDLCIPECQLGRVNPNVPMIPCGLCDGWFHMQCLGLPEGGGPRCIRGLYFCQDCLKDLKDLRQLVKPRREKEARFDAIESLVAALDVEQALLKEVLSRSSISLDDVVVNVGDRMVDSTYAALLRERAGLKRDMVEDIATSKASPQDDSVEKVVEPNDMFNFLSTMQYEVQSRMDIQVTSPAVEVHEEAVSVNDYQNIPSTSGSCSSSIKQEPGTENEDPSYQIQIWVKDRADNKCAICARTFSRIDNLKTHLRGVHRLDLFQACVICGQRFHHNRLLCTHQQKKHGGLAGHDYVLVPIPSDGEPQVQVVVNKSPKPPVPNIAIVKKSTALASPVASRALAGLASSASLIGLASSASPAGLASSASLAGATSKRRQIFKTADGMYKCPLCFKPVKKFTNLKTHLLNSHKHEVELMCNACHQYFPDYWTLVSHQNKHHGSAAGRTYTCRPKVARRAGAVSPPFNPLEVEPSEVVAVEGGIIASYNRPSAQPQFPPVDEIPAERPNRKTYQCHKCADSFITSRNLRDHLLRRHQLEVLFSCDFCQGQFSLFTELRRHQVDDHDGSTGYRKLFRRSSNQAKVAGYKPTECQVCGDRFKDSELLKAHLLRVHQLGLKYSCNSCNRRYSKLADLRRHQHVTKHHSHTKVYESDVPGGVSADAAPETPFTTHGPTVDLSSKAHVCHICGASVTRLENLKLHLLRRHNTKVLHSCDLCGEQGSTVSEIHFHQISIHGAKAGQHLSFAQATDREKQLGVKRHVCHLCQMRFETINYLKGHMRRNHQTEYVSTCLTCGQQFESSQALTAHASVNNCRASTGRDSPEVVAVRLAPATSRRVIAPAPSIRYGKSRSFASSCARCTLCRKLFSSKGCLLRHLKVVHPEQYEAKVCPYACQYCGQKFEKRKSMYNHVSRIHPGRSQKVSRAVANQIAKQMAFQGQDQDLDHWSDDENDDTEQQPEMNIEELVVPVHMSFEGTEGQGEWMVPSSSAGSSHSNAIPQASEELEVQIKVEKEEWAPIYLLDTQMSPSGDSD